MRKWSRFALWVVILYWRPFLLFLMLAGIAATLGRAGSTVAALTSLSQEQDNGAGVEYEDPRYHYTLNTGAEWWVNPTDARAVIGVARICNYDRQRAEDQNTWPGNPICIQIGAGELAEEQSFEQWNNWRLVSEIDPGYVGEGGLKASTIARISMLDLSGAAYLLRGADGQDTLELNFQSGSQVLSIGLYPAELSSIELALPLLSTLKLMSPDLELGHPEARYIPKDTLTPIWEPRTYNLLQELPALLESLEHGIASNGLTYNAPASGGYCSGPGLFDWGEAPTSPIELWMPFRAGESWTVGGSGSFYGNWAHGNCYNDYYATDWNRSGDYGADVLPVADGDVTDYTAPPCPNNGLGCRVQVTHGSGVRTEYAHLSAVMVTGGHVDHWDQIGDVGNSGDPDYSAHLHLSFRKQEGGSYYSHCDSGINNGNCPNGEDPVWPQSPRPSPINTQNGQQPLVDGNTYVSNNEEPGGSGCSPGNNQISLHVDSGFGGQCVTLGIGDYPNPGAIGLPNDSISSIRVGSDVKATLCGDDNFQGTCETFFGDDSNLADNPVGNDSVSSVRVESDTGGSCSPGSDQVAFYADANFSGTCSVKNPGNYIGAGDLGIGNDAMSSIRVGDSVVAVLCGDGDYQGTCEAFTGDDSDLSNNAVGNDSVSSAWVEPETGFKILIYADPYYTGGGCGFTGTGAGNTCEGHNDIGSSIRVQPGWSSRVWQHGDFGGSSHCFTSSDQNLADNTFDDGTPMDNQISSFASYAQSPCPPLLPSPPSNMYVINTTETSITIGWQDNSNNEEGFNIYWWEGDWVYHATVGANITTFTDTGLYCDTAYFYDVTAFNGGGESTSAGWIQVDTDPCTGGTPSPPTNLSVTDTSLSSITLSWQDNSNNEDGFNVFRWDGSTFVYWDSVGANVTSYTDSGLDCGSDYYYKVNAYNEAGESSQTPWVMGNTDSCSGDPNISVSTSSLSSVQESDTQVTRSFIINNYGSGALNWTIDEALNQPPPFEPLSSLPGASSTSTVGSLPVSAEEGTAPPEFGSLPYSPEELKDAAAYASDPSRAPNASGVPVPGMENPEGAWQDDFDNYATGSSLHGQGGWKGWLDNPAYTAYTTTTRDRSAPNSVDIRGNADLVHEYSGITSGVWNYSAWQYVPGSATGTSYFILLNQYDDAGASLNWSTQVRFDNAANTVVADNGGSTLPLLTDQWVEISVEIDLDNNVQRFFYGGDLLFIDSWTDGVSGGGILNIGAVDLFANGASTVYYDDLALLPLDTPCFDPVNVSWVDALPDNGTIGPGGSATVSVTFDSTGLQGGTYVGTLCINSNDPDTPLTEVSLTMTVTSPDTTPPEITITYPQPNAYLNEENITITAIATDEGSGVYALQFYVWHDDEWDEVGWDHDPEDGWELTWDASGVTDQLMDFWIYAYDEVGNYSHDENENVAFDLTAPQSSASGPGQTTHQTVTIHWTATDNLSGVDSVRLWVRTEGGAWHSAGLPAQSGNSGNFVYTFTNGPGVYRFATRAEDRSGNFEAPPTSADFSITYQSAIYLYIPVVVAFQD